MSAKPKVEHAANGAKHMPRICPSIEICDDALEPMFHSAEGETSSHGASGAPQLARSARNARCLCLMTAALADSTSPSRSTPSISRSASR
ncbi:MAG: hypothetical protein U0168_05225 [Nannocystaceae bacterium]